MMTEGSERWEWEWEWEFGLPLQKRTLQLSLEVSKSNSLFIPTPNATTSQLVTCCVLRVACCAFLDVVEVISGVGQYACAREHDLLCVAC